MNAPRCWMHRPPSNTRRGGGEWSARRWKKFRKKLKRAEAFGVRLPGFVREEEIGLGDVVKRMTFYAAEIRPCGGCEKRAAALNRRVIFTR